MLYGLFRANQLGRRVPGGVVRSTWNYLTGLFMGASEAETLKTRLEEWRQRSGQSSPN